MQYSFQTAGDFIDEVKVHCEDQTIEENLVRLQIEKQFSRDKALTHYAVRAGYLRGNGDLYQYYEATGDDPYRPGEPDGEAVAKSVHQSILVACVDLGLTVRKGQCVG